MEMTLEHKKQNLYTSLAVLAQKFRAIDIPLSDTAGAVETVKNKCALEIVMACERHGMPIKIDDVTFKVNDILEITGFEISSLTLP